jgi:O-antigen ligase
VNNNGRTSWKKALDPGLIASPFLGNGPRADLMVLNTISDGKMNEAHNDYLSVRYNYGYVGLTILLFGFIVTFIHLFRLSKSHYNDDYVWMLSTSSLTLFLGFFLFMYSDNILKYTIFFPNLFFAMIGIIYSIKENENFGSHSII